MPGDTSPWIDRQPRLTPPEDYVLAELAEATEAGEYEVGPPQGASGAQRSVRDRELERTPPAPSGAARPLGEPLAAEEPVRFTLLELWMLATFAALGLAGVRWLPPATLAGVLGLVAVVGMFFEKSLRCRSRWLYRCYCCLLVMYAGAAAGALAVHL